MQAGLNEIILSNRQIETLAMHAKSQAPNESCALLLGTIKDGSTTVSGIFLAKNVAESPERFTISNEELLYAYGKAAESGTDVVGIFHSHPTSEAYPSETDAKFMRINPVAWVIYSGRDQSLRAFTMSDKILEVQVRFCE